MLTKSSSCPTTPPSERSLQSPCPRWGKLARLLGRGAPAPGVSVAHREVLCVQQPQPPAPSSALPGERQDRGAKASAAGPLGDPALPDPASGTDSPAAHSISTATHMQLQGCRWSGHPQQSSAAAQTHHIPEPDHVCTLPASCLPTPPACRALLPPSRLSSLEEEQAGLPPTTPPQAGQGGSAPLSSSYHLGGTWWPLPQISPMCI